MRRRKNSKKSTKRKWHAPHKNNPHRLPHFWRWFFTSYSSIVIGLPILVVILRIFFGSGDFEKIDFFEPLLHLSLITAFIKFVNFVLQCIQFMFAILLAYLLSALIHSVWWRFYERYYYEPEKHTRGYYLRKGGLI